MNSCYPLTEEKLEGSRGQEYRRGSHMGSCAENKNSTVQERPIQTEISLKVGRGSEEKMKHPGRFPEILLSSTEEEAVI